MLRGILRNVQYYLLFFSTLLVLLAFQRLRWFDQVFPHPYALSDHPFHGHWRGLNGGSDTESSPDGGRIFYGGDESKEIGLFRFRLGLFKFVLPTFSSSPEGWERTTELSRLMTVPPPPSKRRRKSSDGKAKYLRAEVEENQGGEEKRVDAPESSAAYVVVINWGILVENDPPLLDRAKALSKSIEAAHENSQYGYQLLALNWNATQAASQDTSEAHKQLVDAGFRIINTEKGDISNDDNKREGGLEKILDQHDVIIQISIDSVVLKPMDDLFDVLLKGDKVNNITGVLAGEKEGKEGPKRDQVDSFLLEPSDASVESESELMIFRSKSRHTIDSYVKRLECIHRLKEETSPDVDNRLLRLPAMVRKEREVVSRGNTPDSNQMAQCTMEADNSMQLDRCLYDVRAFDTSRDCSRFNVKDDSRVARFPVTMMVIEDASKVASADGDITKLPR